MGKRKLLILVGSVCLVLILALLPFMVACTCSKPAPAPKPTPAPAPKPTPPTVRVAPSTNPPEQRLIRIEEVPQPNCGGTSPVSQTIERSSSISHTLELGQGITVSASGIAGIPGIGQVQVGAEVARQHGVAYGQIETLTHSISLSAKEKTTVLHKIAHYEVWETGDLLITAGGETSKYPYSFRKAFRLELIESKEEVCPSVEKEQARVKVEQARPIIDEVIWRIEDIVKQVDRSADKYPMLSGQAHIQIGYRLNGVLPLKQEFDGEKLLSLLVSLRSMGPKVDLAQSISDIQELHDVFFYECRQPPGQYDFVFQDRPKFDQLIARLGEVKDVVGSLVDPVNW